MQNNDNVSYHQQQQQQQHIDVIYIDSRSHLEVADKKHRYSKHLRFYFKEYDNITKCKSIINYNATTSNNNNNNNNNKEGHMMSNSYSSNFVSSGHHNSSNNNNRIDDYNKL